MGKGSTRNQYCECGSEKKYKNCCLKLDESLKNREPTKEQIEALHKQVMQDVMSRKNELEKIGIFVGFVEPIIFNGNKVWALGNRVYHGRPPNETFHEFLLFVLIHEVLGEEWWTLQASLSENEQHHIYRSFKMYQEWCLRNQQENNRTSEIWSALPDGWSRSLLSLAFDVASLKHAGHLPEDILARLKSRDHYQSARYEIAIASIFARLGYEIEFLDEKGIKEKHCEFFAHDKVTKEIIAVEVKSRIRKGVLHEEGVYDGGYWAQIQRFYKRAQEQNPEDRPFLIFFDINAPQDPSRLPLEKPWVKEVKALHDKIPLNTPENPDLVAGLVFTNYSFHYQEQEQAVSGEHLLTIPLHPVFPILNIEFWNNLQVALNNYGNVPNLDIEFGK